MLSTPVVNTNSIDYAVNRISTFKQVNIAKTSSDARREGLRLYCASFGLTDDLISHLFMGCESLVGTENASHLFIGVLIGLGIMEYNFDNVD